MMSFVASKIAWIVLRPSNALVLAMVAAVLVACLQWKGGRALLVTATSLLAICTLFPVSQWLLYQLENRLPSPTPLPAAIDGVVVLGGGINGHITTLSDHIELTDAGDRVTTLIRLGRRYPNATLVYSGGSSDLLGQSAIEANQARAFYQQLGFNPNTIVFEDASRNTWENALNSKALVKPDPDQQWLLVTSASHMPRAVGVFRQVGWAVMPFPVDFKVPRADLRTQVGSFDWRLNAGARLNELDLAVKEWIGLMVYWLSGKTSSLLPAAKLQAPNPRPERTRPSH